MRKRLVGLAAVTLLVCLISITASAQNPNYGVEVDCEDTQIELEADPTNIVEGYLDCTITNPSVHLEKIYYDFRTNSAAMSSPNSGYITLNGGESEILEITITPSAGMWADTYTFEAIGYVVEVWGAPPPTYVGDSDSGTFTVLPYYDFETVGCSASFSDETYSLVDLRCLIENYGNTYDKFAMTVPQASIDAMTSYGFKPSPAISQSFELLYEYGFTSIEGAFIFEGDTSQWRDNDTLFSLNEVILVNLHSQGAESEGTPLVKPTSLPIQFSIEKEIVEDQYDTGGFLFAPGMTEVLLVFMLAFAFVRRGNDEDGRCGTRP